MQATATAPRSARATIQERTKGAVNTVQNLDAPRFFVQMGFDVMHVDTPSIPNKYLLRGEITPCTSHKKRANVHEVPEGARVHGSESGDPAPSADPRIVVWASYWVHAQQEADRLLELEQAAALKQGLVEITTLADSPRLYEQFDLNEIFYPQGLGSLPMQNAEMLAHLQTRRTAIEQGYTGESRAALLAIADELIAAVRYVDEIQRERVEQSHRNMKLSPSDLSGSHKRGYDQVDREMLLRTNKPRLDQADDMTAEALTILANDKARPAQSDGGIMALVEELRAQNQRQNDLIGLLMSERQAAKAEKAEAKAEVAADAPKPVKK